MRAAVVALTPKGTALGLKVAALLRDSGCETAVYTVPGVSREFPGTFPMEENLGRLVGDLFNSCRALVMIMALGIVIRTLAPHVRDKRKDPAVVVMDEGGGFVISALSGHVGGANDLARLIADGTRAAAVITTATDVGGVPAVDVLARDYNMSPEPPAAVKKINAALARGEKLTVYHSPGVSLPAVKCLEVRPWSDYPGNNGGWRALVTPKDTVTAGEKEILLRPRNLVAGVGCRRGAGRDEILEEIWAALRLAGRSPLCLKALATIQARLSEAGMISAARELGLPLLGFSAVELNGAIEKYGLSMSQRVFEKMGVGGVCEPAAMLACRKGKLIVPKRKGAGITTALAEEESGWWE